MRTLTLDMPTTISEFQNEIRAAIAAGEKITTVVCAVE